jgi:site-specific recombinase XerD
MALIVSFNRKLSRTRFRRPRAHQTTATADSSSQGLAEIRYVGTDVSSHNMRKTFATRLLSRGAAITDVQHLLGHASVKTTEKTYAAFVKNERFKQTIDLLDTPAVPMLKIVK